jgi:HD-GYP domain-containing protein (c-di-GMP phosphodiesterase class II)
LTQEERRIINNHIVATIEMLEALPYPKYLKRVPEYAGGHHERMDGKGYPRGLKRDQMSIPARIMAIADVFEALTASDRPYKKAMPLSVALKILSNMKQEGHIDPDIFDIFVREEVYLDYAGVFLPDEQIDIGEGKFDVTTLPGYNPNLPARKKIRLKRKTRQVAPPSTPPAKSPGNRA